MIKLKGGKNMNIFIEDCKAFTIFPSEEIVSEFIRLSEGYDVTIHIKNCENFDVLSPAFCDKYKKDNIEEHDSFPFEDIVGPYQATEDDIRLTKLLRSKDPVDPTQPTKGDSEEWGITWGAGCCTNNTSTNPDSSFSINRVEADYDRSEYRFFIEGVKDPITVDIDDLVSAYNPSDSPIVKVEADCANGVYLFYEKGKEDPIIIKADDLKKVYNGKHDPEIEKLIKKAENAPKFDKGI